MIREPQDRIITNIQPWTQVMEKASKDGVIQKDELTRLIAKMGNFTLTDSAFIINLLIEIFEISVLRGEPIEVYGLGKMKLIPVKPRKTAVGGDGKKWGEKVLFSLSDNIRDMAKMRLEKEGKR